MKIKCPHCDQSLEGDGEIDGKSVDCPACGKSFIFTKWIKAASAAGPNKVPIDLSRVQVQNKTAPVVKDQISKLISEKENKSGNSEISRDGLNVYCKPILASIYHVCGLFMIVISGTVLVFLFICILSGQIKFTDSITNGVGAIVIGIAGLFTYGIGQVFDQIGKTAFYAELSTSIHTEQLAVCRKMLSRIEEKK
jgi:hypothetical protein